MFPSGGGTLDAKPAFQDVNKGCLAFGTTSLRNANVHKPPVNESELLLAQSMHQLSLEERDKALYDLHGIVEMKEELPEFLESKLCEFDRAIGEIAKKKAYLIAKAMSSDYVASCRLQFLRAENYVPEAAADRFARYLQKKLEIFGKEKLVNDVGLRDFTTDDMEALRSGFAMLFDEKDRSGRVVIYMGKTDNVSLESRLRIFFYLTHLVAKDEENQKRGMVLIKSSVGQKDFFIDRGPKVVELLKCIPIKLCGLHFCYDNPLVHGVMNACTFMMKREDLVRTRFHYGSLLETFYALMGYGIGGIIPSFENGRIKEKVIEQWIQKRIVDEASSRDAELKTVVPKADDVLLGRGKKVLTFPGNVKFRHTIEANRHAYDSSSKFEKSVLIETILRSVKDVGGRFLQNGPDGYFEVDDDVARKKISHAWRNLRASSNRPNAPVQASQSALPLKRGMDDFSLMLNPYDNSGSHFSLKRIKF